MRLDPTPASCRMEGCTRTALSSDLADRSAGVGVGWDTAASEHSPPPAAGGRAAPAQPWHQTDLADWTSDQEAG